MLYDVPKRRTDSHCLIFSIRRYILNNNQRSLCQNRDLFFYHKPKGEIKYLAMILTAAIQMCMMMMCMCMNNTHGFAVSKSQ